MIHYKFSRQKNKQFSETLKQRVNRYFREADLGRNGDQRMAVKSAVILAAYLLPYAVIVSGLIQSVPILFGLWIFMGVGKAFVGTSVMHDALHGSYSGKKWINKAFGLSAVFIGAHPEMWKLQHNVLHHTYTNIEHADEDISPRYVLRFSPHQPRRWFHRYQHLYAPFFYSLSTFLWVVSKDFYKVFNYRNKGLVRSQTELWTMMATIIVSKVVYVSMFLIVPMLVLDVAPILTFAMYCSMHVVTGTMLTLIFQTAHVMPNAEFSDPDDIQIDENWNVHQLLTTTNYATKNKVVSWLFGGLNFQIEHHLFPHICHVHYPDIAPIVRQTAGEFGIPYHEEPGFLSAVRSHFRMLRTLGSHDTVASDNQLVTA